MNTEILLDHEPAPGGYLVRALLRVTGEAPDSGDRRPLNLALVLDRSGSMGSLSKLEYARRAATLLVRRLGAEDVIGFVANDDEVRTVARGSKGPAVHHSYPRQESDEGLRLELGDLYSLEPRTLLTETLIGDDGGDEADVAHLTIEGHSDDLDALAE